MTGELDDGVCVCGRDMPPESPSDWACSEPCQSAWLHHQANPQYPHPREIRENAEARAAAGRLNAPPFPGRAAGGGACLPPIADGTEVHTDTGPYVRVGNAWQPAGMWTPAAGNPDLVRAVAYQRWCPQCRTRRDSQIVVNRDAPADGERWDFQTQTCTTCGHVWRGRPLVGVIESRGEPWPALRLRLSDGYRSVATTFPEPAPEVVGAGGLVERLQRTWPRLERQMGGGFCDADQPTRSQLVRADRARRRQWDVTADPGQVMR